MKTYLTQFRSGNIIATLEVENSDPTKVLVVYQDVNYNRVNEFQPDMVEALKQAQIYCEAKNLTLWSY